MFVCVFTCIFFLFTFVSLLNMCIFTELRVNFNHVVDLQKHVYRGKRAVPEKIAVEILVRGDHSIFQR